MILRSLVLCLLAAALLISAAGCKSQYNHDIERSDAGRVAGAPAHA